MDIGVNYTAPNAAWLQTGLESNLGIVYPLLLNPNGGPIGIWTNAPTPGHALTVNGEVSVNGAVWANSIVATNLLGNATAATNWLNAGTIASRASNDLLVGICFY